jgi:ABC-type multidrug transport system fused ATPase/permease subunit
LPAIEARNVWFSYSGGVHVLRGASLKASGGEAVAVVGPTGLQLFLGWGFFRVFE